MFFKVTSSRASLRFSVQSLTPYEPEHFSCRADHGWGQTQGRVHTGKFEETARTFQGLLKTILQFQGLEVYEKS